MAGHPGRVVWLTGLSGSGKSTIANALECELHRIGLRTYVLDGDTVRQGLNSDLGFSDEDRAENVRRVAQVARLFLQAGVIVIVALISPFRVDRDKARALFAPGDFLEVYVNVPLEVAEQRDTKGLYRKARQGLLPQLTGVGSAYEPPHSPELVLCTDKQTLSTCVDLMMPFLVNVPSVKS